MDLITTISVYYAFIPSSNISQVRHHDVTFGRTLPGRSHIVSGYFCAVTVAFSRLLNRLAVNGAANAKKNGSKDKAEEEGKMHLQWEK